MKSLFLSGILFFSLLATPKLYSQEHYYDAYPYEEAPPCPEEVYLGEYTYYSSILDPKGSIDFDYGYRRDALSCINNIYNPADTYAATDRLDIKKLRIVEGGVKGQSLFRNAWFVKGFFYAGYVEKGDYEESVSAVDGTSSKIPLNVTGGNTVDFSVGGGYLFSLCDRLKIVPVAGWSYNRQHLRMKGKPAQLNGLTYTNRWQGAWVGGDLIADLSCFGIHAGYEYHFPRWHAEWLLKGKDVFGGAFSDVRHANKGYGNVAFLEAYTLNWGCVRFNCQVKWQYWKVKEGRLYPKHGSFASVGGGADEKDKISKATWRSFEGIIGAGLNF